MAPLIGSRGIKLVDVRLSSPIFPYLRLDSSPKNFSWFGPLLRAYFPSSGKFFFLQPGLDFRFSRAFLKRFLLPRRAPLEPFFWGKWLRLVFFSLPAGFLGPLPLGFPTFCFPRFFFFSFPPSCFPLFFFSPCVVPHEDRRGGDLPNQEIRLHKGGHTLRKVLLGSSRSPFMVRSPFYYNGEIFVGEKHLWLGAV